MKAVEKAEKRMYDEADESGIDISIKDALHTLGGWQARSPADFTAEYFKFGMGLINKKIFMLLER